MYLQCTFSLSRTYESKGFWSISLIRQRRLSNEKIQYLYCTVSSTVTRDDRTIKIVLFHQSAAQAMQKMCYCYTFYNENRTTYRYITGNKKILFVKTILAYCGYSRTCPFFFLVSEHKDCDNAATNLNSGNARSRMVASLWEAWLRGNRKMSKLLGAFGLLDFTMLRPVLAWRAFWNLWTVYFFNFPIFFGPRPTADNIKPQMLNKRIWRSTCIYIFKIITLIIDVLFGLLVWYRIHSTEKHSSHPSRNRSISCLQGSVDRKLNTVIESVFIASIIVVGLVGL